MLYIDFWTSYWKNLNEITSGHSVENSGPSILPAPPSNATDGLTPKEKYEYLTEYGTQILCMLSTESGCTYLSRNFESITGQSCDNALGNSFYTLVHPDFHERLFAILATSTDNTSPVTLRCKLRHGDGAWQWYMFLIHPKRENTGNEYVCIIENIHESIQAQSTLQKAKLEAELALRARSEFLANMSHELRTPLNAVIGFAQIMESQIFGKLENPHYVEYVKHIQESGYDLLSKIEDLFEIANIDAGRVEIRKEEVPLSDILRHAIGAQLHHASAAGVTLQYHTIPGEVVLHVDRLKLQHILGHLLGNAIKFSPRGSAVTLDVALNDRQELLLRIRDNGTGIPRTKLNEIVAAMKEDNGWTAKNNHSIGLGLALTKEFISLHGGSVKIISKVATGTTVYITLPQMCLCGPADESARPAAEPITALSRLYAYQTAD